MENSENDVRDFRIDLTIGTETVELGVPSGEGLPNRISIKVAGAGGSACCPDGGDITVTAADGTDIGTGKKVVIRTLPAPTPETGDEPEEHRDDLPSTLEELFRSKYPDKVHVYRHICDALGKHADFPDLTKPNLMKIKGHLSKKVAPNSVAMYCAVIKACMNLYCEEGVFNCRGYAKILRQKKVPSVNVYLSEDEIRKIEQYVPRTPCERDVKTKFLIEYYTGARLSDVEKMSVSDVKDNYVTYVSQKTKVLTKVPAHKNLTGLLKSLRRRPNARSIYNRTIKRICRKCGIDEEMNIFYRGKQIMKPKWKFVGSHTARRSFATNLSLRNVPVQVISRMMSHSGDIKMTEKYILADVEGIDENTLAFFK